MATATFLAGVGATIFDRFGVLGPEARPIMPAKIAGAALVERS